MALPEQTGVPKIGLNTWNAMVQLVNALETDADNVTDIEQGPGIALEIVNGKLRISATSTGTGSGYAAILDYNTATNTWPSVPAGIPAGQPILWRGPSTAPAPPGVRLGDDVDLSF